jgi:hypothetical protein
LIELGVGGVGKDWGIIRSALFVGGGYQFAVEIDQVGADKED